MYVDWESQNIIVDKVEDIENTLPIKTAMVTARMLYCLPCFPTVWAWSDYLVTVSNPRER